MESDDRLLSLGLMPSRYEYIKYTVGYEDEFDEWITGKLNELFVTLDYDAI